MTNRASDEVEITFRRMLPTDDLVYFVRRSCRRFDASLHEHARWRVVLHRGSGRVRAHVMRNHAGEHAMAAVADVDPFVALSRAFASLAEHLACQGSEPEACQSGVYDTFGSPARSDDAQTG